MWNEFDRMKKMESDPKYRKQGKRRWKQFVTILSCFVVFCTAYVLIMPAAAQNTQTFCDISPHTHQNTCYDDAGVLTCKEIEHEHTRQCSSDPKAIETAEEWEATIPKNLSDDFYERTVEIARSQLGYQESKDNFRVNEDETEDGFTRYGAWMNQPYESWNNAFTGWVIHYADVPIPFNRDISAWAEGAESDLEKVKAGDILFFDRNEQLHSGIVTDVEEDGEEKIITVIAGDIDHSVKEYKPKTDEIRGAVDLKEGLAFCGQVSHVHTEECYKSKEPLCGQDENDSKEELPEEPSEPAEEIEPQSETEMPVSEEEPGAEVSEGEEVPEADNESEPVELAEETENTEAAEPATEEPHEHSDECYVSQELQCGKEEHTHTRECQSNPNAVETEEDWKKSLPAELKADLNERVLQIAESQLEYTESRENFRINADQSESSYSRFGAWAGDPYGEWNNYFTGFVLNYAGSEVAFENDLGLWINQLQDKLKEKAEPGDVVFFNDANGILYSGIVKEVTEDQITVIQGDAEGSVKTAEINISNCISFVSPGNTTDEDKNASAEGKSVTINGVKEVGVGDEVVLSADPSGFNGEVKYQWQYKDGDEDWKNLEQENQQKLTITITEENINWLYRVGVKENSSNLENKKNGTDENQGLSQDPLQFQYRLIDSDLNEEEDNGIKDSEVLYSEPILFSLKDSNSNVSPATNDDSLIDGFSITKKIDYLGDGVSNADSPLKGDLTDFYRLYLSAGPIAGEAAETPINVLYVVDTSGSMKDTKDNKGNITKKKITAAKEAIQESWNAIHALNSKSQRAVITFSTYANTIERWSSSSLDGLTLSADGGTCYTRALNEAQRLIDRANKDYPTFMIFLSDGAATLAIDGYKQYGNGYASDASDTNVKRVTKNAINQFKTRNPNVTISTIGYEYDDNTYGYLSLLSSNGTWYEASATEIIDTMSAIVAGPSLTNGEITDTLTEYVDFVSDGKNGNFSGIKIVAVDKSQPGATQVLWSDGQFKEFSLERSTGPETAQDVFDMSRSPVTISGKTITARFKPDWKMNTKYEYVLSFDIKVSDNAYRYFSDNNRSAYPNTGDAETDYLENTTSSEKPGFYSNEDSARFSFKYKEETKNRYYSKPVVQIHQPIKIEKTDKDDTAIKLSGAEFSLYQFTGDSNDINYDMPGTQIGEALVTKEDLISLPNLPAGKYVLKETKAPTGYIKSPQVWLLDIGPIVTLETDDDNCILNHEKNQNGRLEYTLSIKNKIGRELPNTGGTGTQLFTFSGIAVLSASCLMYGYRKRSEGKERRMK